MTEEPDYDASARETPDTTLHYGFVDTDATQRSGESSAWGGATPDTAAGRVAMFLHDEPQHELADDLRALLRERDELATALRVEKLRSRSAERLLAEALRERQVTADLRAARDMFRKPEDHQRSLTNATRIDHIIADHEKRHFSPGYDGEKPDHHGPADTCAMPACRAANLHNAAADAIHDANPNGRDPE